MTIVVVAMGLAPPPAAAQDLEPVIWDVRDIANGRMALADWGNGVPIFVRW